MFDNYFLQQAVRILVCNVAELQHMLSPGTLCRSHNIDDVFLTNHLDITDQHVDSNDDNKSMFFNSIPIVYLSR